MLEGIRGSDTYGTFSAVVWATMPTKLASVLYLDRVALIKNGGSRVREHGGQSSPTPGGVGGRSVRSGKGWKCASGSGAELDPQAALPSVQLSVTV